MSKLKYSNSSIKKWRKQCEGKIIFYDLKIQNKDNKLSFLFSNRFRKCELKSKK